MNKTIATFSLIILAGTFATDGWGQPTASPMTVSVSGAKPQGAGARRRAVPAPTPSPGARRPNPIQHSSPKDQTPRSSAMQPGTPNNFSWGASQGEAQPQKNRHKRPRVSAKNQDIEVENDETHITKSAATRTETVDKNETISVHGKTRLNGAAKPNIKARKRPTQAPNR